MGLPDINELDQAATIPAVNHQFSSDLVRVPLVPIRLRWKWTSTVNNAEQVGYQLRTRQSSDTDWNHTNPIQSDDNIGVDVPGTPLRPRETRQVQVRIATETGWSAWSDTLFLEGAVHGSDIEAIAITAPSVPEGPCPTFTATFDLETSPKCARLVITALGVFDAKINGTPVDNAVLSPGYTSYDKRIILDSICVTKLLREGTNEIEITAGDGWYRGRYGLWDKTCNYGDDLAVLAQIETFENDSWHTIIATDTTWNAHQSAVKSASIYDGTFIDFTDQKQDSLPVKELELDKALLQPRIGPLVYPIKTLPLAIKPKNGHVLLVGDQNVAGWVRLTVDGKAGDKVTVRHAEVLNDAGELHVHALRTAKATDTYILGKDGINTLEPRFTFHGFQFADVVTPAKIVSAEAIAISSAIEVRGKFACSDARLNRFHENVRWSQRGNFVSIPTDCPQRDERLGWTGDAQAFAPAACTLFNSESFWESWLIDLELDQDPDGAVASVIPNIFEADGLRMSNEPVEHMGRAGWGDAATVVPMSVFKAFGDPSVIETQIDSMRRWVGYLTAKEGPDGLLPEESFQYGDWLDPDAPTSRPWEAKVSSRYVSNAFYVYSARLLAQAEEALGNDDAAKRALDLANKVAAATWEKWQDDIYGTQTGAALGLQFAIVPASSQTAVSSALAALVRESEGRISTGFLGTPHILDALASNGHLAEAYMMLFCTQIPSWLYQVERGATTVWERWDAIFPDGTLNLGMMEGREDDAMVSYNHYAYGAVIDWVYRNVAGIGAAKPGYSEILIAPRPTSNLDFAEAEVETAHGPASIRWDRTLDGNLEVAVTIPNGTKGLLNLPVTDTSVVTVDGKPTADRLSPGSHQIIITNPEITDWS